MRRRRQTLQVSTFPFLAVLLCAMGSLILLLLVIDRRARVVARAKAMQAALKIQAEESRLTEERKAELERRRQELHQALLLQDQELLGQMRSAQGRLDATARQVQVERTHFQDLRIRYQNESSRLSRNQALLAAGRAQIGQKSQLSEASRKELTRLAMELERFERTLDELKALRKHEQPLYSVVPYSGKRGDNRKPIYVECTTTGLMFHPDRTALTSIASAADIRTEVERRIAAQQTSKPAEAGKASDNAYLMMLVRPDGLVSYYQALSALDGLKLDFGYEFVEADWVLDFPTNDTEVRPQPWMKAESQPLAPAGSYPPARPIGKVEGLSFHQGLPSGAPAGSAVPGVVASPGAGPRGSSGTAGDPATASLPGNGTGAGHGGLPGNGAGHGGLPGNGAGNGGGPWAPGSASRTNAGNTPSSSSASSATGLGPPRTDSSGSVAGVAPGATSPGGMNTGVGPGRPGTISFGPTPKAPGGGSHLPGAGSSAVGSPNPTSMASIAGAAPSNGGLKGINSTPGVVSGQQNVTGVSNPGPRPGENKTEPGSAQPSDSSQGTTAQATASGPRGAARVSGEGTTGASGTAAGPGNSEGGGGEEDPIARRLPSTPQVPSDRPRPVVRPGLLSGNRDWIILLECTNDAVRIHTTGQKVPLDELTTAGDNRLARTLKDLIDRRQASVPEGVPPYRPIIRFLVRPNGSKAYFLAYPALEKLRLPMSRVNLEPDDDIRRFER